jgi:hypothetical protein
MFDLLSLSNLEPIHLRVILHSFSLEHFLQHEDEISVVNMVLKVKSSSVEKYPAVLGGKTVEELACLPVLFDFLDCVHKRLSIRYLSCVLPWKGASEAKDY